MTGRLAAALVSFIVLALWSHTARSQGAAKNERAFAVDDVGEVIRHYRATGRVELPDGSSIDRSHDPQLGLLLSSWEMDSKQCGGGAHAPLEQARVVEGGIAIGQCTYGGGDIESASIAYHGTPNPPPPLDWSEDHWLGLHVGGPNGLLATYQVRLLGPLFLHTGLFALHSAVTGSAGAVIELPLSDTYAAHVGAGGSLVLSSQSGREPQRTEISFVYGRFGLTAALGPHTRVGVDLGFWRGHRFQRIGDDETNESFTYPMVGAFIQEPLDFVLNRDWAQGSR